MKFKRATKPLLARYATLLGAREAASQAVFDAALPRNDIPWQTCYRDYADTATRERYDECRRSVFDFELAMAHDERRGWFDPIGRFNWY